MSDVVAPADLTDDELQVALDHVLADYVLANKYVHNHHMIPAIREQMTEISKEFGKRGLKYSHEKAMLAAGRLKK